MYLLMDTFDFSAWLAQKRGPESFRKLAERSGVSAGHLSNLENGTYKPTDETLEALAKTFQVDPEWLIAQVDTTREETQRKVERLRKHAPEFLGLPAAERPALPDAFTARREAHKKKQRDASGGREVRESDGGTYEVVPVAAGFDGTNPVDPDRKEYDQIDGEGFTE